MPKFRFYEKFMKCPLLRRGGVTLGIVIPLVILITYAQNNVGSTDNTCNGYPRCNPFTTQQLDLPDFLRTPAQGKDKVTQLITPRQKIYLPLTGCEKINFVSISIKGTNQDSKQPFECRNSWVVITFKSILELNKEYELKITLKETQQNDIRGYFQVVPESQRPGCLPQCPPSSEWELENYQLTQEPQTTSSGK